MQLLTMAVLISVVTATNSDDHAHTMSGVSLERNKIYYINFGGIQK